MEMRVVDMHSNAIEEKYRVADFDIKNLIYETKPENSNTEARRQYGYAWEDLKRCKWWRNILVRNVLILLLYLVIHITIQAFFQADKMCPIKYWQKSGTPAAPGNATLNAINLKKCRTWATVWFTRWGGLMKDMSKVITFLVGFYVSTIVKRWWEQIRYLPLPVATNIQLANIIDDKKVTADEALALKKKIMRYFHLSWTLVMSQRNAEWFDRYKNSYEYVSKGLLTDEEEQYLKAETETGQTTFQTMWFVPINWACILVKKAYNVGKMKDPKDMLKDVSLFQKLLDLMLRHKKFHIPIIFSHAVWLAVIGWIAITLIGAQNTEHWNCDHHKPTTTTTTTPTGTAATSPATPAKSPAPATKDCGYHSFGGYVFLTIPGHELFVILLILSWLQAADKLNNPFGEDRGYDADLNEVLDTSLWRSSKILQQEYLASSEGKMEFLSY